MTIIRTILQLILFILFTVVITLNCIKENPDIFKLIIFILFILILFLLTFQLKSKSKSYLPPKDNTRFIKWLLSLIGFAGILHGFEFIIDPGAVHETQNRYRLLNILIDFTENNFGLFAAQVVGFILWCSLGGILLISASRIRKISSDE